MKVGVIKKELGTWMAGVEFTRDYARLSYWPVFRVWCMKISKFPEPGSLLTKNCYRGFYLYWTPPYPIVTLRAFTLPQFAARILGYRIIVLPIHIKF